MVRQAEDAFGTSVGRETIGIYNSSSVRGFSPTAAGNVRIEGLYFDQVWNLTTRLRRSTSIKVGLSAQSYPFPAPTGVVDYAFRIPGTDRSLSASVGGDDYGTASAEIDAVIPITRQTLGISLGGALYHSAFYNGTSSIQHVEAVSARWSPAPSVEIVPFWARSDIYDDETGPLYAPAGPYLPPRIPRHRFNGPDWVMYEGAAVDYGALGRAELAPGWQLRAGLFRSFLDVSRDAYSFLTDLTPDGRGHFQIFVDPPYKIGSTSGEIRLSHQFGEGPRTHVLLVNLRARDRRRRYGGTDFIDLGDSHVGEIYDMPRPAFVFDAQTSDRVRQWTGGLAYEGRWRNVGEISIGIQRSDYRKSIAQPGLPITMTHATPWLFHATAAGYLTSRLVVYAGYTRGLEESGVAPQIAVNRNEALPAILTSQRDAGIRYQLRPGLRLVAGVFDLRKPYFTLDAGNRYRQLGAIRSQGVEVSLSGAVTPRLNVVLGGVLLRPRVRGEDVRLGRVGPHPVDLADRSFDLNADWRVSGIEGVSVDAGVSYVSPIVAARDNMVKIPARTLVSLGGRYQFRIDGHRATLRVSISNIFNTYGFELRGPGTYDLSDGRVASSYLTVDF